MKEHMPKGKFRAQPEVKGRSQILLLLGTLLCQDPMVRDKARLKNNYGIPKVETCRQNIDSSWAGASRRTISDPAEMQETPGRSCTTTTLGAVSPWSSASATMTSSPTPDQSSSLRHIDLTTRRQFLLKQVSETPLFILSDS